MNEIVGIGSAVFDTLIVTDRYPAEDTKMRAKKIANSGGGPCATGLVAASKLGAKCAYLGVLANDFGGKFLLDDFVRYNVDTKYIKTMDGRTSFRSFVLINESASTRTCVAHPGDLPPLVLCNEKIEAIKNAEVLLVDGNELSAAVEGAKIAKDSGTKVLYDAGGLYEGVEGLLPLADILIPSEEFALRHTGAKTAEDAARELFVRYSPEAVVITQGKGGGIILTGEDCRRYPAFSVSVADTNGAGDVFHGAFAFARVKGLGFYESCIFSSAASALKCTKLGPRKGAPTYEEVMKFLKSNGYEL